MFGLIRKVFPHHPSEIERAEATIEKMRAEEKPFWDAYKEADNYLRRVQEAVREVERLMDENPSFDFTPRHYDLSQFRCRSDLSRVPIEQQSKEWEGILLQLRLRLLLAAEGRSYALDAYNLKRQAVYNRIVGLQDYVDGLRQGEEELAIEAESLVAV